MLAEFKVRFGLVRLFLSSHVLRLTPALAFNSERQFGKRSSRTTDFGAKCQAFPLFSRYNVFMLQVSLFILLVSSFLTGSLQARQAVSTFQGHAAELPARLGLVQKRTHSGRLPASGDLVSPVFLSCLQSWHDRHYGSLIKYYAPDYQATSYGKPETVQAPRDPAVPLVTEQREDVPVATREKPLPKSQVIDIPRAVNSKDARLQSPTIFILTNGERLESRRFLLSASNLYLRIDGHHRTIPIEMLDVQATMAANRQHGIDLRIPADRNEIVLSF